MKISMSKVVPLFNHDFSHIQASRKKNFPCISSHRSLYANMPMQYIVIIHGCKNGNFPDEKKNVSLFLLKT